MNSTSLVIAALLVAAFLSWIAYGILTIDPMRPYDCLTNVSFEDTPTYD